MSKVVFIFGAGASKQAGTPLMLEFLDVARGVLESGKVSDAAESFQAIFGGMSVLQQVHSKSQLDIQNVESVFAAYEMAKTIHRFGSYNDEQIDDLLTAMRAVIVKTVEQTLMLPVRTQHAYPPVPYEDFGKLVQFLVQEAMPRQTVSIITFNYDVAVDYALHHQSTQVQYALGTDTEAGIPVLKLHGSLNWARCTKCSAIVPWKLDQYLQRHTWNLRVNTHLRQVKLLIGSRIRDFEHCGQKVEPQPVIVPPTWGKLEHHRVLSRVWSRAAKELSEAEHIFIIGYSLPLSDSFFRYLYALGTVGQAILQRFWVFNPDTTGEVEARFRQLLGPGATQRFQYFPKTFENSISIIKTAFTTAA